MNRSSDETLLGVVDGFGIYQFSTADFVGRLEADQPELFAQILEKFGRGGKGAGKHYSSFSWLSQQLSKLSKRGHLFKLEYRPAPQHWGSPVVRYWAGTKDSQAFPDEIPQSTKFIEGAVTSVLVNKYERNPRARDACVARWGVKCAVCVFDFEKHFGDLGRGFIHVHHLKPISEIGAEYEVDAVEDLRPVCPNCHSMLHRTNPPLSIDELKVIRRRVEKT